MSQQIPAHTYLAEAVTSDEALNCLKRDLVLGSADCETEHRAHVWQALLLARDGEAWEPAKQLRDSRLRYAQLERENVLRRPDGEQDPLSESPAWETFYKDQERRAIIKQDCKRIFPDDSWFQQDRIQQSLEQVLFIWCKLHAQIDYRQGMHELAGVILWVVDQAQGNELLADTYALFEAVMLYASAFYEVPAKGESQVCARANKIQYSMLAHLDPALAERLSALEIEPQMYTLKWLRLLFLREFPFNQVLVLWDLLFAADRTLALMDEIACTMLLRLHDALMRPDTDYSAALTLLMRFPHPGFPPALFVQDALTLRAGASGQSLVDRYQQATSHAQNVRPPLADATANLAGVAGYSIGALLNQTDRLGLNNYFKGTLTELSRGVTEARQVLSRQSTGTPTTPHSPSPQQVNRELAGHLALVISNLRNGDPLEENLQRLEELKHVLQGRKTLAELKQTRVPERQCPSTAPEAQQESGPAAKQAATIPSRQVSRPTTSKRVSLQGDFGFLL